MKEPEILLRRGKPAAVLIDIDQYEEILERLEQIKDVEALHRLRQRPLMFKSLSEYLKGRGANV